MINLNLPKGKMNLKFVAMKEGRILRWNYPEFYVIVCDQIFDQLSKHLKPLTLFIFGLPLIVGICHSLVILRAIGTLSSSTDNKIIIPIFTSIFAYVVIYLGYFVLTVRTSNQIVNK
ncbi:hypothetical protein [Gottfriedia acidiceleris]|uniref:hypothetical protein n=1 Tax=Gottfriedia acidiceleris TaxID=371036 RepID=UPI003D21CE5C